VPSPQDGGADGVREEVLHDGHPVRLAPQERLRHLLGLLERDVAGERRLEGIDDGLHERGPRRVERLPEDPGAVAGRLQVEGGETAGFRDAHEVDRLELDPELGVAQERHLLPLDLPERVVLDDHDLDRQLVLGRRHEVGHQHRERPVAHEGDDLAPGVGDLGGERVGEAAAHGGEVPRAAVHLPALGGDLPRPPGRDGAGVGDHDGVRVEQLAELAGEHLGFHRHLGPAPPGLHELPPVGHPLLGPLEEAPVLAAREERQ
jgi:hypothetical protein